VTLLVAIVFGLWALSFAHAILSLALVPRLRRAGSPARLDGLRARPTFVSIIVPARNEARIIEQSVHSFLAQDYPALEVIVVNDRSTDATGEILRGIADPRLVVIDGEEPPAGWLGKPWALAEGSRAARGELLLFVDADVIYAPATVAAAVAHMERGPAAMITFFPHFDLHGFWEHIALPQLLLMAYAVVPAWLSNRTRWRYLALGGGPGNLIRRDVYDAVGGYERLKNKVIDDIGLARLVRMAGHRTEGVRADDLVSLRMYHGPREIFDGFTKNLFSAFSRSYLLATFFFVAGFILNLLPYALPFVTAGFVQWLSVGIVVLISLTRLVLFTSFRYGVLNALLGHPLMYAFWTAIYIRSVWQTGFRNEVRWRGRTYGGFDER
jgi:glycosyltransferase involved in cell wall biosynthesis